MENDNEIIKKKLSPYFSKIFEDDLLHEIIKTGTYNTFTKGETLISIGDEMTHIPLLINGAVKITREDKNKDEILLYYLEKGDTCAISFINCINQSKSAFRGIIEKDTECVLIPVNKVEDWLINYKTWREFIIDSYHFRLTEMVKTIKSLAFMNLDDRILDYLKQQVKIAKKKTIIITHQQIAEDLNSSRVVISRLLKKLEAIEKIKLGRNKIHVLNL